MGLLQGKEEEWIRDSSQVSDYISNQMVDPVTKRKENWNGDDPKFSF